MSADKQNLQDTFLNFIRKNRIPVTVFLINGVKLQGVVTWFDNYCVLLRRDGQTPMVFKHAISTVMPAQPMEYPDADAPAPALKPNAPLQDQFLVGVRDERIPVTVFLVNGVKLQGVLPKYDNFCVLLRRDGMVQLVYKHAISTVMPSQPVALPDAESELADKGEKKQLQEAFLSNVLENKNPQTIFLINGVKLQGVLPRYDNFCVLLRRDGTAQLVYKHAISTMMPAHTPQLYVPDEQAARSGREAEPSDRRAE